MISRVLRFFLCKQFWKLRVGSPSVYFSDFSDLRKCFLSWGLVSCQFLMLIGNHRHTLFVFIYWFWLRNAVEVFLVCWEKICLFWLVPLSISLASMLTTSQWASHVSLFHVGIPFIMTEALLFVENNGLFCFSLYVLLWIKVNNTVFDTL